LTEIILLEFWRWRRRSCHVKLFLQQDAFDRLCRPTKASPLVGEDSGRGQDGGSRASNLMKASPTQRHASSGDCIHHGCHGIRSLTNRISENPPSSVATARLKLGLEIVEAARAETSAPEKRTWPLARNRRTAVTPMAYRHVTDIRTEELPSRARIGDYGSMSPTGATPLPYRFP